MTLSDPAGESPAEGNRIDCWKEPPLDRPVPDSGELPMELLHVLFPLIGSLRSSGAFSEG